MKSKIDHCSHKFGELKNVLIVYIYNFQNSIRWKSPRAPSFLIEESIPVLLDEMLNFLLPTTISLVDRDAERHSILEFITQLIQMRRDFIDRDFSNSLIVNNVSALMDSYPFVSTYLFIDAILSPAKNSMNFQLNWTTQIFSLFVTLNNHLGLPEIPSQSQWPSSNVMDGSCRYQEPELHQSFEGSARFASKSCRSQFSASHFHTQRAP